MPISAVFAHYDPHGVVRPHVVRHLVALGEVADRLVVVSTATLDASGRSALREVSELVERENVGYDFFSFKVGLDLLDPWSAEGDPVVILANDSVVGPLVPYQAILERMHSRDAMAWGITRSAERIQHLQSYVLGLHAPALRSPEVRRFWTGMVPASGRAEAISLYELGFSQVLEQAGIELKAYFEPDEHDEQVARERRARQVMARRAERGEPVRRRKALAQSAVYNPMIALWDRAIDGRLPFVKIETLRDDPYGIGGEAMLSALEHAHPEAMAGVREYLDVTRRHYRDLGRGTR